ncbi:MAG: (2Fe-2S)-binding protein [Bacteroidetes bacterium]|jgi:[NiFe] hydrogenase diaphorase moiety small subunit|nr:(2Fe-2S)-binding protein [Bacteroidota bacterium]MCK4360224.1 (2Fe-2S)-binding protein [Bacteroidales bacterium]MCK4406488.1 (2Fe-2S)-binding protein [Bacteroidales bacterium]
MSEKIKFTIDDKECFAEKGQNVLDAATDNGIFIPALCHIRGVKPAGACRLCNVKIAGRLMTACTTPVESGMEIENDIPEIQDLRLAIIEMLFVEGNHFCPACEKSGNCELQALAYRYQMMVPRFPYEFPVKEIDASIPKLIIDHNRCILCKRCIRSFKDENGKNIFAFKKRGHKLQINIDEKLSANLSDEMAQKAMDICPVGAIIHKGKGFDEPIGTRKYDKVPIGSDIESVV